MYIYAWERGPTHIHIYIYIYVYMCVYIYMYTYIFMNTYVYRMGKGPYVYTKETYTCWQKSPIYAYVCIYKRDLCMLTKESCIYMCLYKYTPGSERPHGPGGVCWIWKNHQNHYYSCRCVCVCVYMCMYVCVCVCKRECAQRRQDARVRKSLRNDKTPPSLFTAVWEWVSEWGRKKNHQIPCYSCRGVCERETHTCARAREGEHHQIVPVCVRNEMRERVRESWGYVCEWERVCYRERVEESCRYVREMQSEKEWDKERWGAGVEYH